MSSDEVTVDLTGYRDRVGSRVVPGRYKVVVEDAETDTSKAGNPMVNMWLRVADGGEFDGATIVDRLVLTEKSLFRVVGFMQAIGMPTPKKRLRLNIRQFVGRVLEVDVEDGDPYNGRVKSEVRGYLRIPGTDESASEPLDVEDLETVSAAELPPARSTTDVLDGIDSSSDDSDEIDLDAVDLS